MARRRYRRYRRKFGKWSANIQRIGPNSYNIPSQTRDIGLVTLVTNESYSDTRGNNILRVKNVEATIEFEYPMASGMSNSVVQSCTYYLLFVPEGYNVTVDTPIQHPEWIMAYRFTGSPSGENTQSGNNNYSKPSYKIKSRLCRNLNTGDRVVLLIEATNISTSTQTIQYQGLVRWWR